MPFLYARTTFCLSLVFVLLVGIGARAFAAQVPTDIYISICGDGIVESGEVCDAGHGQNTGAYGSSIAGRVCLPTCDGYGPYCGDGVLQTRFGEECDDGNNASGDLCSSTCKTEVAVPQNPSGPTGGIPSQSGTPGTISSTLPTQVVLRGEAYPNASIDILLDGTRIASTLADSSAGFLYTSSSITPGTVTFSFIAHDTKGVDSLTSSATFDVVQGAVTTVSNIFIPPSISASAAQLSPGDLLTLFGESVPGASVTTQLDASATSSFTAQADTSGNWALQIDTASLSTGYHAAKSYFQTSTSTKSGFGRAVSFFVGTGTPACSSSSDLNGDSKVNLVDFSIFLTHWGASGGPGDFNCDGKVNLADFSIMLFNWTG